MCQSPGPSALLLYICKTGVLVSWCPGVEVSLVLVFLYLCSGTPLNTFSMFLRKLMVVRGARRVLRYLLMLLAFAVVYVLYVSFGSQARDLTGSVNLDFLGSIAAKNVPYVFYNGLFESLANHRPMDPPEHSRELMNSFTCKLTGNYGLNDADKYAHLSWHNLRECYHLTEEQYSNLAESHSGYLRDIEHITPRVDAIVNKGSSGIVTVGGARYSVLLITMLETLRHSGTTLPVEVFIPPSDEGDDEFCNEFVPKFGAKCIFFKDVLPPNIAEGLDVKSYQIKAMALLMSRFENVLFLDADNFAMKNLDHVFDAEVYQDTGLVIWPDLWRRVTAPVWYDLANVTVDLDKRVRNVYDDVSPVSRYQDESKGPMDARSADSNIPFHDLMGTIQDPASESGQMLVNKRKHMKTLLLALYYNIFGPMWYYRMFSQGTAGEGDKETFISAAHALGLPYYQVRTPLAFDGFHHDTKAFQGLGLLQHDFDMDYQLHRKIQRQFEAKSEQYARFDPDYNIERSFKEPFLKQNGPHHDVEVDVMFLHASFYKFDPWTLYDQDCFKTGVTREHLRGYRNQQRYNYFDFELFNFEALQRHLCNADESKNVRNFKYLDKKVSEEEWPRMCAYINDHVEYLKENPLKKH